MYLEVSDEAGDMEEQVKCLRRVKIMLENFARKHQRWLMGENLVRLPKCDGAGGMMAHPDMGIYLSPDLVVLSEKERA